jgi:hypothetical protein
MEEPSALDGPANPDELHATPLGRALWQSVQRPRRGRRRIETASQTGPYETKYPISNGYPEDEAR